MSNHWMSEALTNAGFCLHITGHLGAYDLEVADSDGTPVYRIKRQETELKAVRKAYFKLIDFPHMPIVDKAIERRVNEAVASLRAQTAKASK